MNFRAIPVLTYQIIKNLIPYTKIYKTLSTKIQNNFLKNVKTTEFQINKSIKATPQDTINFKRSRTDKKKAITEAKLFLKN